MRQAHPEGVIFSPVAIEAMQSAFAAVCRTSLLDDVTQDIVAAVITRLAGLGVQDPDELAEAASCAAESCRPVFGA